MLLHLAISFISFYCDIIISATWTRSAFGYFSTWYHFWNAENQYTWWMMCSFEIYSNNESFIVYSMHRVPCSIYFNALLLHHKLLYTHKLEFQTLNGISRLSIGMSSNLNLAAIISTICWFTVVYRYSSRYWFDFWLLKLTKILYSEYQLWVFCKNCELSALPSCMIVATLLNQFYVNLLSHTNSAYSNTRFISRRETITRPIKESTTGSICTLSLEFIHSSFSDPSIVLWISFITPLSHKTNIVFVYVQCVHVRWILRFLLVQNSRDPKLVMYVQRRQFIGV